MRILSKISNFRAVFLTVIMLVFLSGQGFAQVKIMPLGDSITKGVTGSADNSGYRNELQDLLTAEGITFDFIGRYQDGSGFDTDHEGFNGLEANEMLDSLQIGTYFSSGEVDIVLLHIGTNDITSGQGIQGTADEVGAIIDEIVSIDPGIQIVLSSLIPRDDLMDGDNDELNSLLSRLYLEKRDAGVEIFWAGNNELFKANPNWANDYLFDALHPNDTGYSLMAEAFLAAITNALTFTDITVTDNFERINLTAIWDADPEIEIQQNGGAKDLVNTATTGTWEYMAVYQGVVNPSTVKMTWGSSATIGGAELSALAVFLDSADPDAANGYAISVRSGLNEIRLWFVQNGTLVETVDSEAYAQGIQDPGANDELRVDISPLSNGTAFNVFINDQLASDFPLDDVGYANQQGSGSRLYSGVILHANQSNDIADFTTEGGGDLEAPAGIDDLAITGSTATSASLSWTAVGDNGTSGNATSYDLRYSTSDITNDTEFNAATQATGLPIPAAPGTQETFIELDLQPETTYFFAIKAVDDAGNTGPLSNVPSVTTGGGELFTDDFNRSGPDPGADWNHNGNFIIDNNELANSSTDNAIWDLAIYNVQKNAVEVSFKWGTSADAPGIDQGGVAVMLDSPDPAIAQGYLITRRTAANEIRLWEIPSGGNPTNPTIVTPNLGEPQPGDEFRIAITSDQNGNQFSVYVNGVLDQTITDPSFYIDPNAVSDLYSGVMLAGGRNNNVDDFKLLTSPISLTKIAGDGQTGTVGAALDTALTVRLRDGAGDPLVGENIVFEVTQGGGSLIDPSGNVVREAESGALTGKMTTGSDPNASGGTYIHLPEAGGANNQSGDAEYTFSVTEEADYIVWGRVLSPDGESDSFFLQMNDGNVTEWLTGTLTNWTWAEAPVPADGSFHLLPGQHTLTIAGREDGTQLDEIIITRDPGFVPSGIVTAGEQLTVATDANGEASASWVLGTDVNQNPNMVSATYEGFSIDFSATAVAGAPAMITKFNDSQVAAPGTALPLPLEVELRDQFGNLVINNATTWTVITGNGTLGTPSPINTDALGRAQNTLTTATDTAVTEVQVAPTGYTGEDIIFKAFAEAGQADQIIAEPQDSGNGQTGTAGKALAKPFRVVVTDDLGSPVAGHDVTFSVVSGSGNFNGQPQVTVQTDAQGVAQATMTLGPSPGVENLAQATAFFEGTTDPLNGSPVPFTATASEPEDLVAVSPLSHTGTAGASLPDSIEVRVLDGLDGFVGNYPVTFTVTQGDGQVNGNSNSVEVTTDANGIAKVQWTLGPLAGVNNNKIEASASYQTQPLQGSPIEFTSSATAGSAENLVEISGDSLSGLIQNPLAEPFVVKVTDNTGTNTVSGWPVTFTVIEGGGSFNGESSVTVSTNPDGEAQATLTLGSEAGTPDNPYNNVVEATAQNQGDPLNGSPVTFRAQAIATGARNLELVQGDNQTGQAGLPLNQQVQVKVTDDTGINAIAGHPVTFEIAAGGGTINGTTEDTVQVNTNQDGIAAVDWYLGGELGENAQQMNIRTNDGINPLNGSPIQLQATATTGPPDLDVSTVASDVSQVPADGQSQAQITITLTDKFGNAIAGKSVFIESTGSNNTIGSPQNTNSSGKATLPISSTTAEVKTISATILPEFDQLTNTVEVEFTPLTPTAIALSGGNNQSANVGTAVEDPIAVRVRDVNNNGVPGVEVSFVVTNGGGFIVESNPVTTGSDGIARATWVLGQTPGTNRVEARVSGLTGSPIVFSAMGVSANPTTLVYVSGRNQEDIPAGSTLPQPLEVKVVDADNKPVAGVTVNFSTQLGGGTPANMSPQTDFQGIARTSFKLGPTVGTNIVQAVNGSLSGSPISFTFESIEGPPAKLTAHMGDGGSGVVNDPYWISIKITDINDNPIQGAQASFQVTEGGATIEAQDASTNADGIAAAQLRLPTQTGMVKVRATSSDLPGFFDVFEVTVLSAEATTITPAGGNNQTGTVGRELVFPLKVMVTDTYGNPVPNYNVSWVVTIGGGSLSDTSTPTDSSGIAQNFFTLGPNTGSNQARAVTALEPSQVNFDAEGVTNQFPLFVGLEDMSVSEGNLLQFQVEAQDGDNDPITYDAEGEVFDLGAAFTSSNRTFSWTPGLQQSGEYEVTFTATDNQGGFDAETITITVDNSNSPPRIVDFEPRSVDLDSLQGPPITFSVTVEDADNNPLTYTWLNNSSVVSTSSQYEFITSEATAGTYEISVTVSDGQDEVSMAWKLDLLTSVELSTFAAQFSGFDGVEIAWVTSREVDNLGFNVLRSRSETGVYTKINDELIPPEESGEYQFHDRQVDVGARYFYKLEDVDINGNKTQHGPISIDVAAPEQFQLSQNYPNPFNPETKIRYQLPQSGRVVVKVYDVLGRQIATLVDGEKEAGFHIITWNARDDAGRKVSSGVYYYQILSGEFRETKKMLLLK